MEQRAATISDFAESLLEPQGAYISPERVAAALGIPVASLAGLAGVHRNTLRNPASERLQEKLREMVRVISGAAALMGDVPKAIHWYRNEVIVDYGYRTAAQLVAEGQADAVMTHLRDLEDGASG